MRSTPEELIRLAIENQVDEVVIPDAMGDCATTLELVYDFLNQPVVWGWKGKVAAVVQGETSKEVMACLEAYMDEDAIDTIMLPRILGRQHGRKARLSAAHTIRLLGCEKPIHCLGAFDWVEEVCALSWQGIVRGIDTSLPYCLAKKGVRLWDDADIPNEYVSRSEVEPYFNEPLTTQQRLRVSYNVDQYLRLAGVL